MIGILVAGWSSRNTYAIDRRPAWRGADDLLRAAAHAVGARARACSPARSRPSASATRGAGGGSRCCAIGFLVYFIASIAELNRGPFDLAEAESELVAGYFADYSGIRWSIFMMAEYGGMLVAASLFGAAVFLGGGLGLPGPLGAIVFVVVVALRRRHAR